MGGNCGERERERKIGIRKFLRRKKKEKKKLISKKKGLFSGGKLRIITHVTRPLG